MDKSDSDGRRGLGYCVVTVVYGDRQADLALPLSVPCAVLLPPLLRALRADAGSSDPGQWALIPVGRRPLDVSDTLDGAGVLAGDLLILGQTEAVRSAEATVGSVRDSLEELVEARSRTWTAPMALRFSTWTTTILLGVLLVHTAGLFTGWPGAVLAATVSGIATVIAVAAGQRRETAMAAACLIVGCGWAGLAGWLALGGPTFAMAVRAVAIPSAASTTTTAAGALVVTAGAAAAAAAVAAVVCILLPVALVHMVSLLVVVGAAAFAAVATANGASGPVMGGVMAAVVTLAVGVAPRIALAVGGVRDRSPGDAEACEARFARADRTLIGLTIGLAVVAVAGALGAARLPVVVGGPLAGVIGILLILRSRAFSQAPHLLGPRIGGVVVLAGLWVGILSERPELGVLLVLGAAASAAFVSVAAPATAAARSAVVRARLGRTLEVVERILVVVLVVLAAGLVGLFDVVPAVLA